MAVTDSMGVGQALVRLGQLVLDLVQARHGAVDGGDGDQVEVVHADQVQQEVAAKVAADDVWAAGIHELHDGLRHLVVCYKTAQEKWKPGEVEDMNSSKFKMFALFRKKKSTK